MKKPLVRTQSNEQMLSAIPMAVLGWSYLGYAGTLRVFDLKTIPVCVFHIVTGHPCPLCGLTRAFGSIFAGDLVQALQFNAFAVPVFLAWIGMAAMHTWRSFKAFETRRIQ